MMVSCGLLIAANVIEYAGMATAAIFSPAVEFNALLIYLPINGMNVIMYCYFYVIC